MTDEHDDTTPVQVPADVAFKQEVKRRQKTPSAEVRELKQGNRPAPFEQPKPERLEGEVKDLRAKLKWTRHGRYVGYAIVAAVSAYGAARDSGEEKAGEAKREVSTAYKANAKAISTLQHYAEANTKEIEGIKKGHDELVKRLSREFRDKVRVVRAYMNGYTAALSRPAGGRRQIAKELNVLKKQLAERNEVVRTEVARRKAAMAAARRAARRTKQRRPKLAAPAPNIRALLEQKQRKLRPLLKK